MSVFCTISVIDRATGMTAEKFVRRAGIRGDQLIALMGRRLNVYPGQIVNFNFHEGREVIRPMGFNDYSPPKPTCITEARAALHKRFQNGSS